MLKWREGSARAGGIEKREGHACTKHEEHTLREAVTAMRMNH